MDLGSGERCILRETIFEHPARSPCLTPQKHLIMKTHTNSKHITSLGDLVATVSSYARNERETLAAIQDLFRRGSVVAKTRHGSKRLKLA
jgi:hypothetical protein